ncbi:transglutaminase family protein [Pseudohongiella sp.]|uniref:Protein SirB1 N-terminal domain-containing protein n=2 Tax=root TaxID=1 RepID=A0A0F9VZV1_9ZZZZ|nr:transglutaminase family protein [Pseudohongiella sp.]HDZ09793.1 hypothetical protein [Pseudohongiella sp.]HEA61593.1 hypothetical protein [Pseudohongiella sp.]
MHAVPDTPFSRVQENDRRVVLSALARKLTMPVLLVIGLAFSLLTTAAEQGHANEPEYGPDQDFDRSDFGHTTHPVWSSLTAFELRTLANNSDAVRRENDAATRLALYLLASGDVRSDTEFAYYRALFDRGVSRLESRLAGITGAAEKGELLLHGMHEYFFADMEGADADILAAYDAAQSRLTRVLSHGVYNCISSSLLYIVLAEHFGLQASGVLLPSHAFVQLHLPDGDLVEVETTAINGYGLIHDAEFYNNDDNDWFVARDLEVPTYEDYLARQIVTARELGLENMWHQHTGAERMSYRDRMRLAEIHSYLRPDNHAAQKNRLIYYTRELQYLSAQNEMHTLTRMFQHLAPYLQAMEALATGTAEADAEFRSLLAWLQAGHANTAVLGNNPAAGMTLARSNLEALGDDLPNAAAIRNNLYLALDRYAQQLVEQQAFARARQAFAGLEPDCALTAACITAMTRLYSDWAAAHWAMGDWPDVVARYEDYLALDLGSEDETVIRENLASAYLNWANQDWLDEDRQQAMARLAQCITVLDNASACAGRLAEMRRLY